MTWATIHLSSASPREDPGLLWGLCLLCISKFLHFPTGGGFFPAKSPVLGVTRHPTGLQDALQDFILVLWRVNKPLETSRSDEKLNFNLFFLNTLQGALNDSYILYMSSLVKIPTFISVVNSPQSVLNLSGLMTTLENTLYTITVHLLLLNTTPLT